MVHGLAPFSFALLVLGLPLQCHPPSTPSSSAPVELVKWIEKLGLWRDKPTLQLRSQEVKETRGSSVEVGAWWEDGGVG